MWYDGRTQWSYLKSTGEVNISTPTEAQQAQMNPYQFLSVYKSGYNLRMKRAGRGYVVTMKATNRARAMKTIVVTVGSNYVPSKVQYLQGGRWTTITLSRFHASRTKATPPSASTSGCVPEQRLSTCDSIGLAKNGSGLRGSLLFL